jgi:hypothetical protein
MAGNRRSNTSKHVGATDKAQPWFRANVKRNRRRNELARDSRRKNRRK